MASKLNGRLSGLDGLLLMTGLFCLLSGLWSWLLIPYAIAVVSSLGMMFSTSDRW